MKSIRQREAPQRTKVSQCLMHFQDDCFLEQEVTRSTQLAKFQAPGEGRVVFLEWSGRDLEEAVCVRRRRWKKLKKIGNPPPESGVGMMRGPAEKAEEGVARNRIRERCFPNGSRLTLVCGRVEGTSESLFFFSFSSRFFNPPLRCEGRLR